MNGIQVNFRMNDDGNIVMIVSENGEPKFAIDMEVEGLLQLSQAAERAYIKAKELLDAKGS